jgi:hypothetical protein
MPSATPSRSRRLREGLAAGPIVIAPGAYAGLTARLVERSGSAAVYATGAGISHSVLGAHRRLRRRGARRGAGAAPGLPPRDLPEPGAPREDALERAGGADREKVREALGQYIRRPSPPPEPPRP